MRLVVTPVSFCCRRLTLPSFIQRCLALCIEGEWHHNDTTTLSSPQKENTTAKTPKSEEEKKTGVYIVTLSDKNWTVSHSKNRLLHLSCREVVKKICEQMTKWLVWKGQRDVEKDHLVQSELRDVQLWNWLGNTKRPSLLCGPSKHWDLHKQTTLIVFSPYLWKSCKKKKTQQNSQNVRKCWWAYLKIINCTGEEVKRWDFYSQSFPVYSFHLGAFDKNNSVHRPLLQMVKQRFQTIRWR